MDIIITGYWLDGSGSFDGYLCKIGDPLNGTDIRDEQYFYYFDSPDEVAGTHLDFAVTDWEAV